MNVIGSSHCNQTIPTKCLVETVIRFERQNVFPRRAWLQRIRSSTNAIGDHWRCEACSPKKDRTPTVSNPPRPYLYAMVIFELLVKLKN
jgi:hypothetical protein